MVAEEMKCVVKNPLKIYQWLWHVTKVDTKNGERVPMEKGDQIIVCIAENGKASFIHRSKVDQENTILWNSACAVFCEESGIIVGSFPSGRTFKMALVQSDKGIQIMCNHRRNPEEGEWYGDDVGLN